jgi:hypothetical protein
MRVSRRSIGALVLAVALGCVQAANAADDGEFELLFNGKDLTGWMNPQGKAPSDGWKVEDGAMSAKSGAGDIWTKKRYGDFVLELEFKTSGNSGVFIRTDKPTDNVQTGIEIQVDNPGNKPDKHSVGSIYDLVAPVKEAGKRNDWNELRVTAVDNVLTVELNKDLIAEMDLNRWTEPGKNPDGSKNKFSTALKDFKREGHVGFQDHGSAVMYRNVKIKPVTKK